MRIASIRPQPASLRGVPPSTPLVALFISNFQHQSRRIFEQLLEPYKETN
jgi:hypothetical protein